MSLRITAREFADITIFECQGRITLGEDSAHFRSTFDEFLGRGRRQFLVDLGGTQYIDSSGILALTDSYTKAVNKGGRMKLLSLTKRVKDMLQLTKLYTVFEVFNDESAAIDSFGNRGDRR